MSIRLARCCAALLSVARVMAQDAAQPTEPDPTAPLVQSVVLATSADELWRISTTPEGMREWMVPFARVDLRAGGSIETSYDPAAVTGDPDNIRQAIQALHAPRLLASRGALAAPFAARLADPTIDGVLHLDVVDPRHTRFTTVMLGWGEGETWAEARAFFVRGNAWYLEQLAARYPEDEAAQTRAAALLDAWAGAPWVTEQGERWFVQALGPAKTWLVSEQDGAGAARASALIASDPETGALSRWRLGADGSSERGAVYAEGDCLYVESAWTDAAGVRHQLRESLTHDDAGTLVQIVRESRDDEPLAITRRARHQRPGAAR